MNIRLSQFLILKLILLCILSSGCGFNLKDIFDSDSLPDIKISTLSNNTTEKGGTAVFSVVLNSQPIGDVTINFDTNNPSEGIPDQISLIFTIENWDIAQNVMITGQDDYIDDDNQIYAIIFRPSISNDADYDGITPITIELINLDDDVAAIHVSPITGATTEDGGLAFFNAKLNSEPTSDVTLNFNSQNQNEGIPNVSSLIFNRENWSTPQMVFIKGQDDLINDGNQAYSIVFNTTGSIDSTYAKIIPKTVDVINIDNDRAGITLNIISNQTTEGGGTASFNMLLDTQPTADVSVNFDTSNPNEGVPDIKKLIFTEGNWSIPQVVTITGVNDYIIDGTQDYDITFSTTTSEDSIYQKIIPDNIHLVNADNDFKGITVSPISNDTTEAGGTASFSIILNTQPEANVSLSYNSSNLDEGILSNSNIIFTSENWSLSRTVILTGVDDYIEDGNCYYSIIFNPSISDDSNYNSITPDNITVTNIDNDSSGYTVSPISNNTTEAGGTAFFTIKLNSQPLSDVTVKFNTNDPTEGIPDVTSLIFTENNWNTPQTVTVTGVDDEENDKDKNYMIIFTDSLSSDINYNNTTPTPDISVINSDNDPGWVNIGNAGFSHGIVNKNTFFVYQSDNTAVPYVFYRDVDYANKATVMKFNGNEWLPVGSRGFSDGSISDNENDTISLSVYNDGGNPVPYVAFRDDFNNQKATVMKFTGEGDTGWVTVGNKGFTNASSRFLSLYIFNNENSPVPYLAWRKPYSYISGWSAAKASLMKFNGNDWINIGGNISDGQAKHLSLSVYNNEGVPFLFLAFDDKDNNGTTVMKCENENLEGGADWQAVGNKAFSDGDTEYTSLFVYNNEGIPVPYVFYKDTDRNNHGSVMAYNESSSSWQDVGQKAFTNGAIGASENDTVSLFVFDDNGNPLPYVAFRDISQDNKASVMKFNGTDWENVGIPGISEGGVKYVSLFVLEENGFSIIYISYCDEAYNNRATVKKFE